MGRKSQNKVTSCVSCHNVSIKYLRLEGISKTLLVKFKAEEYIINSISPDRRQYLDYLQTIYHYIQKYLKTAFQTTSIPPKNHQKIKVF